MLTGSCLCRAIRYEVSVPIAELRACHCKDCQKSSGAGGSVNAMIPVPLPGDLKNRALTPIF